MAAIAAILAVGAVDDTPRRHPPQVVRPPEPSDVIWENLGCADGAWRQVVGTTAMTLLSLTGSLLIGGSTYLQPKAEKEADSATDQIGAMVVGTLVLLVGYLAVFLVVPVVEAGYMRHASVTNKSVSQVLKLIFFQVLATVSTIGVFALDTSGALNRDWCARARAMPAACARAVPLCSPRGRSLRWAPP